MSLASLLPAPKGHFQAEKPVQYQAPASAPAREIPPYGARRGFLPSEVADFGDGGAFPEIASLQYPLNMGRANQSRALVARSGTTSLQVDAQGNTKYDAVIRQGIRKDQKVYSAPSDLIERDFEEKDLRRPSAKKEEETTEATRLALERLVEGKISAARPRQLPSNSTKKEPTYFRYTPGQQGAAYNSGAESRVIRLHEMPTDPLEPPKYKHKKVAGGPPSPPVPVMQSPPRKVTVKDQKFWKIPPCVSNWKNIKGYTIPLDKRLASDGRHLQEKSINPKFARLAESLVVAERSAREEVEHRMRMRSRLGRQKKEQREKAIMEKARLAREQAQASAAAARESESMQDVETQAQAEARMTRDEIREERKRERQREVRMSERDKKRRKNVSDRNRDRDVSEKIALGQQVKKKEATYDQRLFNQSQGMDSGFRGEEAYDVYDKPLFNGSSSAQIYKPKKVDEDVYGDDGTNDGADLLDHDTSRFRANREFEGTSDSRRGPRNAPIQFEKDKPNDDEFGIGGLAAQEEKRDSDRRRERKRSRHQSRERSQAREELRRRRRQDRRRDFSRSRSRSPPRRR